MDILELVLTASFEHRDHKFSPLSAVRIKIEILKRLLRAVCELKIIENKDYLELELDLQEISKMANGWLKFLNK